VSVTTKKRGKKVEGRRSFINVHGQRKGLDQQEKDAGTGDKENTARSLYHGGKGILEYNHVQGRGKSSFGLKKKVRDNGQGGGGGGGLAPPEEKKDWQMVESRTGPKPKGNCLRGRLRWIAKKGR